MDADFFELISISRFGEFHAYLPVREDWKITHRVFYFLLILIRFIDSPSYLLYTFSIPFNEVIDVP